MNGVLQVTNLSTMLNPSLQLERGQHIECKNRPNSGMADTISMMPLLVGDHLNRLECLAIWLALMGSFARLMLVFCACISPLDDRTAEWALIDLMLSSWLHRNCDGWISIINSMRPRTKTTEVSQANLQCFEMFEIC